MILKKSAFATTLSLLTAITAILTQQTQSTAQPPTPPTISVATDAMIKDLPSNSQPFIPTTLAKDPKPTRQRGIICKPSQPESECDDRVPMLSHNYPWSAVGRLQIGNSGHCTATLISEDWILTNAHCVMDSKTHKAKTEPLVFLPNLIDGKLSSKNDAAVVISGAAGTDFSDTNAIPNPNDWALLKIDQPLGKKYGSIGWKAIPTDILTRNANKLVLAGYSFDFPSVKKYPQFSAGPGFTAGIQVNCSITGENPDKALIHNCDTRAGSSGSAIIAMIDNKYYIVAINNAERSNQATGIGVENYAVNVSRLDAWLATQQRLKISAH